MTVKHKDETDYFTDADKAVLRDKEDAKAAKKKYLADIAAGDAANAAGESTEPDPSASIDDIINGNVITTPTWSEQRRNIQRSIQRLDDHIDKLSIAENEILFRARRKIAATEIKPQEQEQEKKLFEALVPAHEAWLEYWSSKRQLINSGFGTHGLFGIDLDDVLGIPVNGNTNLAFIFREAVKAGKLRTMPKGLR
jgi:hypothetical protein